MRAESDPGTSAKRDDAEDLTSPQLAVLRISVLIVALCGIVYELIIATVSSYLLGDSVYQFSITIGLFMFAMGIGSFLTRYLPPGRLVERFVLIELAVALVGGVSSTLLFLVFPYVAFYKPVMYALILIIGTLVGLEIPILTRILSRSASLRQSIASVLSLDYIGALIGSVAFPLVLLPMLGLFRASYSIGLLNFGVALVNVVVFAHVLRRPKLLTAITVAGGLALTAGVVAAAHVRAFAEGQLFSAQVVFEAQTEYQRIILTRNERHGRVRLFIDGHLQFAERDEYRYHEGLTHPVMSLPGERSRVLILGGGDGLVAREVLKYPEVERIDLVDIDPEITRLCAEFPRIAALNEGALRHDKVRLVHTDAFSFVQRAEAGSYDRVIIDLPDPHNVELSKLYSVEFYRLVHRAVGETGFVSCQSSAPYVTREVFWSIARTFQEAGFGTQSYKLYVPTFGMWGFTLAAGSGEAPKRFTITAPTKFLTDEVMSAATVFGKDLEPAPENVVVNSIFEPRLHRLYQLGVKR